MTASLPPRAHPHFLPQTCSRPFLQGHSDFSEQETISSSKYGSDHCFFFFFKGKIPVSSDTFHTDPGQQASLPSSLDTRIPGPHKARREPGGAVSARLLTPHRHGQARFLRTWAPTSQPAWPRSLPVGPWPTDPQEGPTWRQSAWLCGYGVHLCPSNVQVDSAVV